MGIKYVPQDKKVFSDLTVRENLELGSYATKDYNWDPVIDYFPKLKMLMDRKAGYLSRRRASDADDRPRHPRAARSCC